LGSQKPKYGVLLVLFGTEVVSVFFIGIFGMILIVLTYLGACFAILGISAGGAPDRSLTPHRIDRGDWGAEGPNTTWSFYRTDYAAVTDGPWNAYVRPFYGNKSGDD